MILKMSRITCSIILAPLILTRIINEGLIEMHKVIEINLKLMLQIMIKMIFLRFKILKT